MFSTAAAKVAPSARVLAPVKPAVGSIPKSVAKAVPNGPGPLAAASNPRGLAKVPAIVA